MIRSNYHTHCHFCDGSGNPEDFVEEALKKGFVSLGFSSHAPIPFQNEWTMKENRVEEYLAAIHELKRSYQDRIEIYTGLEIDYFNSGKDNLFNRYQVDYVIGSVHLFGDPQKNLCYSVDGTFEESQKTVGEYFHGDPQKFVESYYRQMAEMVRKFQPDILGHLDVLKKNNIGQIYFSEQEPWYKDAVDLLLTAVKEQGTIVEINTGGMIRGYIKEPYPSFWILKECKKRNIPICINSDAHAAVSIDAYFDLAAAMAKEAGYKRQMALLGGKWTETDL